MIIKVCGMRRIENILRVARLGVDWMGFILCPESRRYVQEEEAEGLQANLPNPPFAKVGVFVDAPATEMTGAATRYGLDYLQLHGNEPPALCRSLQQEGLRLIKAISVAGADDLERTRLYEGLADYFLFDTKCDTHGGSGRTFDWSVLGAYRGETPFLLSGGLRPESLEAIRSFTHPRLVGFDLNSGFEIAPGEKDLEKLTPFVHALRTTVNLPGLSPEGRKDQ
ncbi:MAG: phosphoribosylanthranilate isomerase [Tannerellaceae bacterium]|jgi:phosphoribosylanthranilate isomerase|nr:phosphoribosylanthranilate isomerase [Tannerellaceae bacterium]